MFVFDSKNFVRIFPDFFTGTSLLCCRLFNDSVTFFCTLCIKDRNTGTDDPGFLTGDLLHGIPQIFHVIQSNGSNHTHFRIFCGTGCIQPSSKSCLQDHILCFCLGKCQHSHSEQKFKKGRMLQSLRLHLLYRPKCLCKNFTENFVTHRNTIDHDPLIHLYQMRGNEQSCPFPLGTQHCIQVRTYRAFSIRSRHMENLHFSLRDLKNFKKPLRMGKAVLFCKLRNLRYISFYFLICHFLLSS